MEKLKFYTKKFFDLLKYIIFGDDLKSFILFLGLLLIIYLIIKSTFPYLFSVIMSNSMEHDSFSLSKYKKYNITEKDFAEWPFKNGINKGDVVLILPVDSLDDVKEGDVILYKGVDGRMIVHRIIRIYNESCVVIMGDNNPSPIYYQKENCMNFDRIVGKVVFRIPYVGYPKVLLAELLFGESIYWYVPS